MSLEVKRIKMELKKVDAAKEEMEFRIEERLGEIQRLKEQISNQEKRLAELGETLNQLTRSTK